MRKWIVLAGIFSLGLVSGCCGPDPKLLAIVDKRIANVDAMPEKIAALGSKATPQDFKRIHDDIARLKSEVHTLCGQEDGR